MLFSIVSSVLLAAMALGACIVAFPERRGEPIRRWRLALPLLLVGAATLFLHYLPPSNDLRDPQVWMLVLLAAVVGIVRGAMIRLRVDQASGHLVLPRAPEGFVIAILAALLVLADIIATPAGEVGSSFVPAIELALLILSSFLIGRNAALAVRSHDAPHADL
ncbi:hypothetical protein BH11PSE3_BH11PSE3_28230 [soil metagenome]